MQETLEFVLRHGYAILFLGVFAEQIGLPVPAVPVLLAMGALAGTDRIQILPALLLALSACMVADLFWYWLGSQRGASILKLLCRISLEPDSCVRNTENVFQRWGARVLLVAKFVPGLSTAAPPLAGMFQMKLWRFLVFDGGGALLWIVAYSGAGYVFRTELEDLARLAAGMGAWLIAVLGSLLALYIAFKYVQRRRFFRELRIARVTPEELLRMLNENENVAIVDLRNRLELAGSAAKIPGALHFELSELEARAGEIPRDRDVILYCT